MAASASNQAASNSTEKVENLKKKQEKLAADRNERCYFYSVSIWMTRTCQTLQTAVKGKSRSSVVMVDMMRMDLTESASTRRVYEVYKTFDNNYNMTLIAILFGWNQE
jgi:hypothetical protein